MLYKYLKRCLYYEHIFYDWYEKNEWNREDEIGNDGSKNRMIGLRWDIKEKVQVYVNWNIWSDKLLC